MFACLMFSWFPWQTSMTHNDKNKNQPNANHILESNHKQSNQACLLCTHGWPSCGSHQSADPTVWHESMNEKKTEHGLQGLHWSSWSISFLWLCSGSVVNLCRIYFGVCFFKYQVSYWAPLPSTHRFHVFFSFFFCLSLKIKIFLTLPSFSCHFHSMLALLPSPVLRVLVRIIFIFFRWFLLLFVIDFVLCSMRPLSLHLRQISPRCKLLMQLFTFCSGIQNPLNTALMRNLVFPKSFSLKFGGRRLQTCSLIANICLSSVHHLPEADCSIFTCWWCHH